MGNQGFLRYILPCPLILSLDNETKHPSFAKLALIHVRIVPIFFLYIFFPISMPNFTARFIPYFTYRLTNFWSGKFMACKFNWALLRTFGLVCPVKIQIRIFTGQILVSQVCKLSTYDHLKTDQTAWMRRLIWVFTGHTSQISFSDINVPNFLFWHNGSIIVHIFMFFALFFKLLVVGISTIVMPAVKLHM